MSFLRIIIVVLFLSFASYISLYSKPKVIKKVVGVINGKTVVKYYVDTNGNGGWDCIWGYYDGKLVYKKCFWETKQIVENTLISNNDIDIQVKSGNLFIEQLNDNYPNKLNLTIWNLLGNKIDDMDVYQRNFKYDLNKINHSGVYIIILQQDRRIVFNKKVLINN
ncbi:MAG TPA: hypothetical protein PLE30_00475 [Candidatus Kapabacteria bacterium]|nr:hypothetical protein [Candidatus Kapabacteria bacterium]